MLRQRVQQNLRALLRAALDTDGARYATPYRFVRALKAGAIKAPLQSESAAVRLLTVHGAKGLEAPWVLLLDTDAAERHADTMTVLIDWPATDRQPNKLVFLASESQPPACAQALWVVEQAERSREELNALYVAMTRAKQGLVLSSAQPRHAADRSWWQRLLPLSAPFPPAHTPPPFSAPCETPRLLELPVLSPLPVGYAVRAKPDVTPSARIGQAMHRLLEYAQLPTQPSGAWVREFLLTPEQAGQALALATVLRHGEAAWVWDEQALRWHANEVEILFQGRVHRLDRLVQRKDNAQWWVLDYKSAADPSGDVNLRTQLATYQQAVQTAKPGETVHAAFITGQGYLQKLT